MRDPLPLDDWGGSGPLLHLAHANGFPPGTYRRLIGLLRPHFRVVSLRSRQLVPGADPRALRTWDDLVEDLARGVRAHGLQGAVALGHSVGATSSLLAAADDAGLFRAVVALDPVLLTGLPALAFGALERLGWSGHVGPARLARRRREQWGSREEAGASYRRRPLFRGWDPACFEDYLAAGLTDVPGGGVRLTVPRAWEARVFETQPRATWRRLRRLSVPTLVLRGASSDVLVPSALARLRRAVRGLQAEEVAGTGHLLPLQQPEACGRRVLEFLRTVHPAQGEALASLSPRGTGSV